ncbi:MAG: amino acid ABC transporter ATP-binding protein [Oscillospiraceae bacterium]|nr:amino acid ABC transporter ATP-binding protein [Oscillospiraceae bacterium]
MIEIRHLKKEYPNGTPLRDVNTDIRDGEVIAVIGPSGTGKSTLLRCLNLLETPTAGSIRIDGEEILDPACDVNRIRRKLGMVFQSFNLFSHLTALENIMKPQMDLLGRSKQEAYDRSIELLKRVGLVRAALQYPNELSGGQKQRIAIARTLAMDPEIILFDEPTSALDPAMIGEVEAVIRDLARAGKTMMIVTHEMNFARSISTRVFYMDNGEIYEDGTPEQIFDNPRKELTRRFIHRIKVLEIVIDNSSCDLPGAYSEIALYCVRNRIPPKTEMRIQLVFEELVQQILITELGKQRIRFRTEYSEADGSATIVVDYNGETFDPKTVKNELSLTLIKNSVSNLHSEPAQDDVWDNRLCMSIRS